MVSWKKPSFCRRSLSELSQDEVPLKVTEKLDCVLSWIIAITRQPLGRKKGRSSPLPSSAQSNAEPLEPPGHCGFKEARQRRRTKSCFSAAHRSARDMVHTKLSAGSCWLLDFRCRLLRFVEVSVPSSKYRL